jgi:hypothetical protein
MPLAELAHFLPHLLPGEEAKDDRVDLWHQILTAAGIVGADD